MCVDDFQVRDVALEQSCSVTFSPVTLSVLMPLFLGFSPRVGGQVGIENSVIQVGVALGLVKACRGH